jgi:hypothetical protein
MSAGSWRQRRFSASFQLSSPRGVEPAGISAEGGVCGRMSVICHDPSGCWQAVASTSCSPLPVSHILSLNCLQSLPSAARVSAAMVTCRGRRWRGYARYAPRPVGWREVIEAFDARRRVSLTLIAERGDPRAEAGADQRAADEPRSRSAGRRGNQGAAGGAADEAHLLLLRNTRITLHSLAAGGDESQ